MKLATRHGCATGNYYPHTSGNGAPKRKKCAYCGSAIYVSKGVWGVFVWTGTGLYPLGSAVRVFARQAAADDFTQTRSDLVTRWIIDTDTPITSTLETA